ncbi:MAG: hypothetical protein ABIJ08_01195 [Nanoarchaeota archaeon]
MKVLALDFDGVIADSVYENFYVSYLAYIKLNPDLNLYSGCSDFDSFEKRFYKKFRDISTYSRAARYYSVVHHVLDNGIKVKNQSEFDKIADKFKKSRIMEYNTEFYNQRAKSQKKDMKKWLLLSSPFKKAISVIKKIQKMCIMYIVTNKDKNSVLKLCKHYGLSVIKDNILDSHAGIDKVEKLGILLEKYAKDDIIFVDDLFAHCLDVKKAGFNVFMPIWGYNTKEEERIAKKKGITLLTQSNFYDKITKALR